MTDSRATKRLRMLEQAIAAGSKDPFIYYARALEFRALGELQDALAGLADVEARFPDYVPTFLIAGQVAMQLEQPENARTFWKRGLAVATRLGDEHARTELAQALETLDQ